MMLVRFVLSRRETDGVNTTVGRKVEAMCGALFRRVVDEVSRRHVTRLLRSVLFS